MKIIISHDVDHLYPREHIFKDLIIEKMWVRSLIHLCQRKISFKTFIYRLSILFRKKMHNIDELMEFDEKHKIPSVFFFGMDNVLGMSYTRAKAKDVLLRVKAKGFDIGVHGVDYLSSSKIKREHDYFEELSGMSDFGVRNHYVRFDDDTFKKQNDAGYIFDSTWFNKKNVELRAPYKVGNMWEFPLHIMDAYVCIPGKVEEGINNTIEMIKKAESLGMPYCIILFHDTGFNDSYDPELKQWYEKTILFLEENNYEFISYRDAIKEMEGLA